MSKFVLEILNDVNGNVDFFKILEERVGLDRKRCYWNEFCKEIEDETNWACELDEMKAVMDDVANGEIVPKWKWRKYKGIDDTYEAKTDNLRAYILKDENGYIIIYAGKKSDQDKGINRYKSITKRYLAEKQNAKRKNPK
ncbi:MAG TPA: hypothetical protein VIJ27_07520 [Mucilaginibacter sp.]